MKRLLIVGAGVAGMDVLKEIKASPDLDYNPIGFIDDDQAKLNKTYLGVKVLGNFESLGKLIKKYKIDDVIIAIPSAEGEKISKYLKVCSDHKVAFRIVPRVKEIIEGKATISLIRKVGVEDLLGRPVVKSDVDKLKKFLKGKIILVTGAAGSIGSELSMQIAFYKPKKLILLDCWENGVFDLQRKIAKVGLTKITEFIIGNIQDINRLEEIFSIYKPDYVFHTAAYKHVPLMEDNPVEAIKNNILGTYNVAKTSIKFNINKFVLVSTDKAADPKNIMGMTKLFAEKIVRSIKGKTKFVIVRFGNVLDSNGSVVPIFRKQIEEGGPLTITDKRMTRYFMTIPEASQLILKSALLGKGGELFVLDMGKPVSILKLAHDLIRLSGFKPGKDIKIKFTGIRKGEKLTEKLYTKKEELSLTEEKKILMVTKSKSFTNLTKVIGHIKQIVSKKDQMQIKSKLLNIIHEE